MIGTVKNWNAEKGFGFIIPDGSKTREEEVFVHVRAFLASDTPITTLNKGQRVRFDVTAPDPGTPCRRAVNIKIIS